MVYGADVRVVAFTKPDRSDDYPQNNIYHLVTPRFNEGMGEMPEIHLSSFQNIT